MNQFRQLSDEEVESLWIEAYKHITMTFTQVPPMANDGGASVNEYLHRQQAFEAVDAEFSRRAERRRKASGSATRWEKSYLISSGRTGTDVRVSSYGAMVGLEEMGVVDKDPSRGSDKWRWRVYQCPRGHKREGLSTSLEAAKAEVDKRIERWFRNCRIDRTRCH